MKKPISKLALKRETLRTLSDLMLSGVAAGGDSDPLSGCSSVVVTTKLAAVDPQK